MKLKQTYKVPRDFLKTIERLASVMGYGDESLTEYYRLDSVQMLQLDLYNTPAQLELDVV
jgi:hypothetical protein